MVINKVETPASKTQAKEADFDRMNGGYHKKVTQEEEEPAATAESRCYLLNWMAIFWIFHQFL